MARDLESTLFLPDKRNDKIKGLVTKETLHGIQQTPTHSMKIQVYGAPAPAHVKAIPGSTRILSRSWDVVLYIYIYIYITAAISPERQPALMKSGKLLVLDDQ